MRRSDRQVDKIEDILEIIRQCDVIRLGLKDDPVPYILPLNFGFDYVNKELFFYFHSALEGKKINLIEKNPEASFEMDGNHQLQYFPDQGYCTMSYDSIMGTGCLSVIEDEKEKLYALTKLMEHYHTEPTSFNPTAIPRTKVYKMTVSSLSAKRKPLK